MAVKTYQLQKLEELGVFYHASDGKWYYGLREDAELTEYLYAAGMFEH